MPYVVQSGSKQYTVKPGQQFVVDRLESQIGDSVDLQLVFSYGDEEKSTKVSAKVVAHQKGKKIRVVKFKNKSNYHRQYGYRHYETVLEIEGGSEKKPAKTAAKKTVAEKKEKAPKVAKAKVEGKTAKKPAKPASKTKAKATTKKEAK